MAVIVAHVTPEDAAEAYQWHREFAESDEHILPRSWDEFRLLADDWELVCARENGEIVGLCYYTMDEGCWEIGGLMVHPSQQGRGLGSLLMRVTLGNLLFDLDPLSRGEAIISHVHRDNPAPRKIIQDHLAFDFQESIQIPGDQKPGLKTDEDGIIHGDVFTLVRPKSLLALIEWCDSWADELGDGTPAHIDLRDLASLEVWARAFRAMAQGA